MQFGTFFYNKRKARQDKMFILTLMLYCSSKSCKIQVAKVTTKRKLSRQREKARRIGNHLVAISSPVFDHCELITENISKRFTALRHVFINFRYWF